jgi:DNA-binding transcriptional LysR family regulator
MDMFNGMRLFTEVVNAKGFAAAGRKVGMDASSVSRQINALEEALGVRLLNRTTRTLSLTEVGQFYYEQASRILTELDDANVIASQFDGAPRGILRVSTPVAFGRLHVAPVLRQFLDRFPEVRVDLLATDQTVDLVEAGIDIALRIGSLPNSDLVARKLAPNHYVLCASEEYLDRHKAPAHPQDLAQHNCLAYRFASGPIVWTFRRGDELERVQVSGILQANSFGALKSAAGAGLGLVVLPLWSAMPCLKSGELRAVLREYSVSPRQAETEAAIYAVYPHRKHLSPKVRAFLDFMVEYIGDPPYWERDCVSC